MQRCLFLCTVLALTGACGDDQNLADPRLIEGGGLSDGSIAGRINVYVIDDVSGEPISGADIYVGEPGSEPLTGSTDSSGLLTIDDGSLKGPTTVTAVATGYTVSTWMGADGVNVTIPLSPTGATAIPQAALSGTIAGWDSLDAPATNHFILGLVLYSQDPTQNDAVNNLTQPSGPGGLPGNACIKSALGSQCSWSVNSRTGQVALAAVIVDVDTNGTPNDDTDDSSEVIGFAYKRGITVEDGVDQSGLELAMLDVANLTEVEVATGTAPTGLDQLGIVLGLELGDDGVAMLGFLQDSSAGSIVVPDLAGPFADASYQALAFAQDGDSDLDPSTVIVERGITDLTAIDLGDFLDLPADLAESGGAYSFTPVDSAAFHSLSFGTSADGQLWDIAVLDGRTSVTLPAIPDNPIPSSGYAFQVSAFEADVDLTDFAIDDFIGAFARVSDNTLMIQ